MGDIKLQQLSLFSDFNVAQEKAEAYLGKDVVLFTSPKVSKKFRVYDPNKNKWIDFGQMGYEDYTKHQDPIRRERYLNRATNTKGNWRDNPYSPNNLSIHILW